MKVSEIHLIFYITGDRFLILIPMPLFFVYNFEMVQQKVEYVYGHVHRQTANFERSQEAVCL